MSCVDSDKPRRKSVLLSPEALHDLRSTAARRRTEREAIEEALRLLAEQDARLDAMAEFVECALAEWGEPTEAEKARAEEILSSQ
ncbi:MAG: hypothetical protein OXI97_09550 [Acidimicrobiaceae bacterium]|nr:hypothetical protein [Acidimicrobiaceae bacterium]